MWADASRVRAAASVALAVLALAPVASAREEGRPPPPPARIEKLARLLELEDQRARAADELGQMLRDPDRGVRRRAALAAGRIADPALVPPLVDLLNDQEVEVRRMAAFALGLAASPPGGRPAARVARRRDGQVRGARPRRSAGSETLARRCRSRDSWSTRCRRRSIA